MSTATQRTRNHEIEQIPAAEDTGESRLADAGAETDRLFAAVAKSFEAMSQGSSQEFLRRSRQTGGQ